MRVLDLKLGRDLWRLRGQVLAIALVLAAATATFVLSTGVHRSLVRTRDAYYERANFADIFVEMTRAPRSVIAQVAKIPRVREVQGAIQQYATLEFPGRIEPVRALINSVDEYGHDRLNRLVLRQGRMPRPGAPDEVVADAEFAAANGLGPGSRVDAIIYGCKQSLRIVGLGFAPNFLYAMAPGDLIPDDRRFGVFWMGRRALEAATDRTEAVTMLSLTLERDARPPDVIRRLDVLAARYGGSGAYGREDHLSNAFLDNELKQLEAMTRVIPPIFLAVSAFLVYVVLGRLIQTERTQIGLIKAFGYSDWAVAWHYLKFALVIAVLAAILGAGAGIWMGRGMTRLYAQYYRFPFLRYEIAPSIILGATALSAAAAALGALGGVRQVAILAPAVAMTPPPPPVYRAGAVEMLGRWAGFTAIGHMIARHIARWPVRSAITVFGVGLSMGLLFMTLQFLDASRAMIDSHFLRAQRQDLTVTFIEPRNAPALHALLQLPGVLRVEPMRAMPVRLSHGNRIERGVLESAAASSTLTARIDGSGAQVDLPPKGLMFSSRMAEKLSVHAGDPVDVALLGGHRTTASLPVTRIIDEFVGERVYAAPDTMADLTRDASPAGSALLRIDPAARASILARLKDMPVVLGVTERKAALAQFERMIHENLYTMLAFYISFASAIAVGVVYNSARILFSERAHELATLRVLGYQRGEVALVLLGELAVLVLLAVPVGCGLGYALAWLMTEMFSSDLFRLPFAPTRATFGYAALIVLAAATLTAFAVSRRVLGLDMVRVLKARE